MHAHHQEQGNDWCIYPMYDWAHGESDYLEQISHSFCTLEFYLTVNYMIGFESNL